jgi:hypothetical protein
MIRHREKVAVSYAVSDGYNEYLDIQQEKRDEENAPYGCDFCCGGVPLPESTSYWYLKEKNDN